jgi:hypothetical protein
MRRLPRLAAALFIVTALTVTPILTSAASAAGQEFDLTVALIDRDGRPQGPQGLQTVAVQSLDDPDLQYWGPPGEIRLPEGRYAVHASIQTARAGQEPSYSFISAPEVRLDHDLGVNLDARLGLPLSITPPDPAAVDGVHGITRLTKFTSCGCDRAYFQEIDPRFNPAYAASVPGTASDTFALAQYRRASELTLGLSVLGKGGFDVKVWGFLNSPTPTSAGAVQAAYGGAGTAADLAKIDARGKLVLIELPDGTTYGEAFERTAAIKAAGATLAMIIVKEGASLTSSASADAPALPTLDGDSVTGRRFAALVKAGPVRASYVINPQPALRYELAYGVEGAVTSPQVYRPRKQDLAAVRTSYHDNAGSIQQVHASYEYFGGGVGIVWSQPVTAPQTRTEYFTPGNWTLSVGGRSNAVKLQAGQTSMAWGKAVIGPTFRGTTADRDRGQGQRAWARRKDGAIDVILPMFGDSAGRPQVPRPDSDKGSIELRRDGQLVEKVDGPDAARISVPDEAATYQLSAEVTRTATSWPLSTRVAASWTFRSSAVQEGDSLPLLTVRFDPAVDVRNRAPSGSFEVPVFVERQDDEHPEVTSLAVEVSYDDGVHWQGAPASRSGDHWTVALRHPKAGFVSLRAKAVDAAGNSVDQTVIRGYEIAR